MSHAERRRMLADTRALYDAGRFVDAHGLTAALWERPPPDDATVSELVLAGRLANRLGAAKLSRHLLRAALDLDPASHEARYFGRSARPRGHILRRLRGFLAEPDFTDADPDTRRSYLASQATEWADVRDFDRALRLVEQALALGPEDGWVHACHSTVLSRADRWEDALGAAERAVSFSPGAPYAASALSRTLALLGRHAEAATRLEALCVQPQSHEILLMACSTLCGMAERAATAAERHALGERAAALAQRLEPSAPLADRDTRSTLARVRMDVAEQLDDRARVRELVPAVRSGFHRRVLENLRTHGEGSRVVLPYRPLSQKHATCLPTSLAAAVFSHGVHLDDDALAAALTYGGTSTVSAAAWLAERGLVSRHFLVREQTARMLVERGLPFILCTQAEASAHATAVIGVDTGARTLLIHDPSFHRRSEMLSAHVGDTEAPLGPEGLLVVPAGRASELDLLPVEDVAAAEAHVAFRQARDHGGMAACRNIVEGLAASHPSCTMVTFLRGQLASMAGDHRAAAEAFRAVLAGAPSNVWARRALIRAVRAAGDPAALRELLRGVVDAGRVPGVREGEGWSFSVATYATEYVTELLSSDANLAEAHARAWETVRWAPATPSAHRALARVLEARGRADDAELPSRLASLLAPDDDGEARAHAALLHRMGRVANGTAFMRARVRAAEGRHGAGATRVALVDWLEDTGQPDDAVTEMRAAVAAHPGDAAVLSYAAGFLGRCGLADEARAALAALAPLGRTLPTLDAEFAFFRERGELARALDVARRRVDEFPSHPRLRRDLLDLVNTVDGHAAALELARGWAREQPGHGELGLMVYEQLDAAGMDREAEALLETRTARDAEDAWAWRELGFRLVRRLNATPADARTDVLMRLAPVLRACQRTCPGHAATSALMAEMRRADGATDEALALFVESAMRNPAYLHGHERAWQCTALLPRERQDATWARLEAAFLRGGDASHARTLVGWLAARHGVDAALASVERMAARLGESRDLAVARASVLLDHGSGARDARRALDLLEDAARRHPHATDVAVLLARALAAVGRDDDADAAWKALLEKFPSYVVARRHVANQLAARGAHAEALACLEDGLRILPRDVDLHHARMTAAARAGDADRACAVAKASALVLLHRADVVEHATDILLDHGRSEDALALARRAVDANPAEAQQHHVLALVLQRAGDPHAAEMERAWRRALELDHVAGSAADALAAHLGRQKRFAEARAVLAPLLSHPEHGVLVRGRQAWLTREEGDAAGARTEMAEVVKQAPSYAWGWRNLLEWLEADGDLPAARAILEASPHAMADDADFRARRLDLLARAGVEPATLDAAWNALVEDFPRDESILLRHYDVAWERRTEDGARATALRRLQEAEAAHPESPFVKARRVEVLCDAKEREAAVALTAALCAREGGEDSWPEGYAWTQVRAAGWGKELHAASMADLRRGTLLRPTAVTFMVDHVVKTLAGPSWLPARVARRGIIRALGDMLELLAGPAQAEGAHLEPVLKALTQQGRGDLVIAFASRHADRVRASADTWHEVGRAWMDKDVRVARRHLAGWRDVPGVQMWMVTNHLHVIVDDGPADLDEFIQSAADALERLPRDHCARLLAWRLCEGLLRRGRVADFLQRMESLAADMEPPRTEDFDGGMPWMPALLKTFADLVRAPPGDETRKALQRVDRFTAASYPAWVLGVVFVRLAGRVPAWRRWAWLLWRQFRRDLAS